ncbi:MAG: Arm DNA-binding domain-containing protein [Acidimicrobiia bacterium]|nr:Arm DNA-binding domain-containing protein [Acidimicrobiia bacterium]
MVTRRTNGRLSKRWNQRVRVDGRETNLGLGVYPVVTLSEARQKALKNRRSIEQGHSPRDPSVPTFSQATERVIELYSAKWKKGSRSAAMWRSSLQRYAGPLGGVGVDKVT